MRQIIALLLWISCSATLFAQSYRYDEEEGLSLYNKRKFDIALSYLQRAAKAGSTNAQKCLGYMYEHGLGVRKDNQIAINLYKRAGLAQSSDELEFENGKIKLSIKGKRLLAVGSIGNSILQASIMVNQSNGVMLEYNIDDGWEETEYGNYVDGKLVFESGIEATVTDKIEGTWKDNDAGYSKMPFVLNFVGSVLVDGAFIYPSAPQIAETLAIVDDGAEKKPEKKETNAVEPPAVEIQYLPPTVEGKETVDNNRVYDVVEEMPEFPGGWSALLNFLATNMKYPKDCQEAGIQGRVVVKFVVDKDGRVTNARVAQPVNPSLDKEALRVINSMPRWTPGKQEGKPVRVTYTVPLMFRLK